MSGPQFGPLEMSWDKKKAQLSHIQPVLFYRRMQKKNTTENGWAFECIERKKRIGGCVRSRVAGGRAWMWRAFGWMSFTSTSFGQSRSNSAAASRAAAGRRRNSLQPRSLIKLLATALDDHYFSRCFPMMQCKLLAKKLIYFSSSTRQEIPTSRFSVGDLDALDLQPRICALHRFGRWSWASFNACPGPAFSRRSWEPGTREPQPKEEAGGVGGGADSRISCFVLMR